MESHRASALKAEITEYAVRFGGSPPGGTAKVQYNFVIGPRAGLGVRLEAAIEALIALACARVMSYVRTINVLVLRISDD